MILALDYGSRYVGVAITDADGKIPLRRSVIDRKRDDVLVAVSSVVVAEKIQKVLVGLPVSLSGQETGQAKATRDFITQLQANLPEEVTVETIDERFTSKEAERIVAAEGAPKEEAHSEAARLLLENYLQR